MNRADRGRRSPPALRAPELRRNTIEARHRSRAPRLSFLKGPVFQLQTFSAPPPLKPPRRHLQTSWLFLFGKVTTSHPCARPDTERRPCAVGLRDPAERKHAAETCKEKTTAAVVRVRVAVPTHSSSQPARRNRFLNSGRVRGCPRRWLTRRRTSVVLANISPCRTRLSPSCRQWGPRRLLLS